LSEVGKPLPVFGHKILFSQSRELQQKQAINYADEFPVLITKQAKQNGHFFGCVARGIIFIESIMPNKPIDITIGHFHARSQSYQCSLFDGLVKVRLPKVKLQNSNLRCMPSQKVPVYFESYNLTLSEDPLGEKNNRGFRPYMSVTAIKPAELGNTEDTIYIATDAKRLTPITDENFYNPEYQWTLIDFNFATHELTLGKASVQVICRATKKNEGLEIIDVIQADTPEFGIDLPFTFCVVAQEINPQVLFAWEYGVEQLLQFARQTHLNQQSSEQGVKQAQFFRRWQDILDYQKKHESERSVEFKAAILPIEKYLSKVIVPCSAYTSLDKDDKELNLATLFKEIEKSKGNLNPKYCFKLQVWNYQKQIYMPALIKGERLSDCILTPEGDFDLYGNFWIDPAAELDKQQFKFTISLPNSAIQRQEQALEALFEDRLVEPKLKDILLNPSAYQSETDPHWNNHPIQWQGRLTPSQKEVVKVALQAQHIALIQGPPGTGKTTAIVEIIYQLIAHNPRQRILLVSQQNTAVDNAMCRFKEKYSDLIGESVNIVRIGNPDKIDHQLSDFNLNFLYEKFLQEKLSYIQNIAHKMPSKLQALSYQWQAVLRQTIAQQGISKISDEFFSVMLTDKNLVGATCVGLANRKSGIDHLDFDVAIVDEAGRATVPELLIPLLRSRKAILIGDHFQLPPSIAPVLREDNAKEIMPFIREEFLEKSFFELLYKQLPSNCTASLKEQFRMADPIGDLVADLFYTLQGERRLFNGASDGSLCRDSILPQRLYWAHVAGRQKQPRNSTSLQNNVEAEAIADFLKCLASTGKIKQVAVITPYGAQKRKIRQLLGDGLVQENIIKLNNLSIKVDTVDSFQGSEADVVCYSTVRTSGPLKFLLDKKRLNVACSRAKENLIFFGNRQYLEAWKPAKREVNLFGEIISLANNLGHKALNSLLMDAQ